MKSKKTMLILPVVAVALCAVALIGAGFAAEYAGTTTNTNNEVDSYYITVTPYNSTDAESFTNVFNKNIRYDTLRNDEGTGYRLSTDQSTIEYNNYKAIALNTIVLKFEQSTNSSNFKLAVSDNGNDTTMQGRYFIGYNTGTENGIFDYTVGTTGSTFGDKLFDKGISSIEITLYYDVTNYATDGVDDGEDYDYYFDEDPPANDPVQNITFTFTATASA